MLRRLRMGSVLAVTATVILGLLLITACGPSGASASQAQQLMHQYPWLATLGIPFIQGLLQQYGSDIADLLIAALVALAS